MVLFFRVLYLLNLKGGFDYLCFEYRYFVCSNGVGFRYRAIALVHSAISGCAVIRRRLVSWCRNAVGSLLAFESLITASAELLSVVSWLVVVVLFPVYILFLVFSVPVGWFFYKIVRAIRSVFLKLGPTLYRTFCFCRNIYCDVVRYAGGWGSEFARSEAARLIAGKFRIVSSAVRSTRPVNCVCRLCAASGRACMV